MLTRTMPPTGKVMFLFFLPLAIISTTTAQCLTAGPNNAGTAVAAPLAGSSFSFSNTSSALLSDNNPASANALLALFNGQTNYLQLTGFNFAIPPASTICGVQVEVQKSATGIGQILFLESYVTDYAVKLVRNGVITGANRATGTHWTTANAFATYGSASDIWGVAWTPADINNANFGIAIAADVNGLAALLPGVHIDYARITVFYQLWILPVQLQAFEATEKKQQGIDLYWKTTGQEAPVVFEAQHSPDGQQWKTFTTLPNTITPAEVKEYYITDPRPYAGETQYRLKISNAAGTYFYSAVKQVQRTTGWQVFPNPFTSYIDVTGLSARDHFSLYNANGVVVAVTQAGLTAKQQRLHLEALPPGIYFMRVNNQTTRLQKL